AAFADAPKDQWREPPPLPLLQGHRRPGRGDLQGARPAPPTRIPLPQPGCLGSAAEDRCPLYPSPPMTLRFRLRRPLAPPHGGPKQRGLPHRPSPSLRRGTLTRLARRRLRRRPPRKKRGLTLRHLFLRASAQCTRDV